MRLRSGRGWSGERHAGRRFPYIPANGREARPRRRFLPTPAALTFGALDRTLPGMKRPLALILVCALLAALSAGAARPALADPPAQGASLPFGPGEKISYNIYWTVVLGGTATLETLEPESIDGHQTLRFRALAKSTPFVDKFYMVRDSIEAWVDTGVSRSWQYKKDQSEGDYQRNYLVTFDALGLTAYRYSKGKFKNAVSIPRGTFDPLSMLFLFRTKPLAVGYQFIAPVTDGDKYIVGTAKVVKRERIKTQIGEFDTFLVEPDVRDIGGVFRKSPDATLQVWITDDERRIPVRVRSKVVVGYFSMEITGYEPPKRKAAH